MAVCVAIITATLLSSVTLPLVCADVITVTLSAFLSCIRQERIIAQVSASQSGFQGFQVPLGEPKYTHTSL